MTRRFVYPTKIWNGTKACLRIQRESEDGQNWFGIEDAIKNYCEEMGLKIDEVEWLVWCESNDDYSHIKAKDSTDWLKQFDQLNITWEISK